MFGSYDLSTLANTIMTTGSPKGIFSLALCNQTLGSGFPCDQASSCAVLSDKSAHVAGMWDGNTQWGFQDGFDGELGLTLSMVGQDGWTVSHSHNGGRENTLTNKQPHCTAHARG